MKRQIYLAVGFLMLFAIQFTMNAQSKFVIPFHPLSCVDSLKIDDPKVAKLKEKATTQGNTYFISYIEDSFATYLKPEKIWITRLGSKYYKAYALDFVTNLPRFYYQFSDTSANSRYLLLSEFYTYHDGFEGNAGNLYFIDLFSPKVLSIPEHRYDYFNDGENSEENKAKSAIGLEDDRLTILTSYSMNGEYANENLIESDILPSGIYQFQDTVLRKVKEFHLMGHSFKPVRYFAKVALGMTLEDIKAIYPNAVFTETVANNYGDIHDNDKTGFEMMVDSQLLMFVWFKNEVCTQLYGISKKESIGNVSAATTIEQLLKLYPYATLKIDLLSDMEYLYIAELDVSIHFESSDNTRIGVYPIGDEPTRIIARKNATPKFILIQ